jgi:hypothetical protein
MSFLVDYFHTVTAPDGRKYTVVVGPPGSGLDSDDFPGNGGGLLTMIIGFVRGLRAGWRIGVFRAEGSGMARLALHRERVADQSAAEARAVAIVESIRAGTWTADP